ncbi:MAG: rhomboid family intramembrane serine protease [Patescibacteria group bacterium]|jgi:membrane associated rhomboid family serine protease
MIPIRDQNRSNITPFMTYFLLAANVGIFLFLLTLSRSELTQFIETYAFFPASILRGENYYSVITSMFIHGGILHIFSNMLFLNIFGDNLEAWLGHFKYLLFYLLSGIGGSVLQIVTNPTSSIPNIGASGAIAGLMGGYLILFPNNRIDLLIPFGLILGTIRVPAFTILFYWFVLQFIFGLGSLSSLGGGIAYFAHIGGFLTGAFAVLVIRSFRKS